MRKSDLLSGSFFILLGLFFVVEGTKLKFGSFAMPKTGFFPVLLGILLIFLSILLVGSSLFVSQRDNKGFLFRANLPKTLAILGSMIVYALFLERVGYLLMTFLWFSFLMTLLKFGSRLRALFYGAIASGASYALFKIVLQGQLPAGFWGM